MHEILAAKKGVLAEAMADTLPKMMQEALAGAVRSYCSSAIKVGASTAPHYHFTPYANAPDRRCETARGPCRDACRTVTGSSQLH